MWKVFKFFGRMLKATLWLALLLFLGGIVSLYIAERGLPDALVQKIADQLSTLCSKESTEESSSYNAFVFRIDRITYSLQRGLTVHRIKMFPKYVMERPFISAEEINAEFSLLSFEPLRDRLKRVTIKGFDFPALPPRPPRDPDAPKPPSRVREVNIDLPEISPFEFVLENANIFGLQAEKVTATIATTAAQATATGVNAKWPERFGDVGVTGDVTLDCETKRIIAHAQGRTFPHLITPLLSGLRAKGVVKQIDCFEDFTAPVTATYTVDAELTRLDYTMVIGVEAQEFSYRGIPAKSVQGTVVVTDTNNIIVADIGPFSGTLLSDGELSGRMVYRDDDDSLFIDVQGSAPKSDLLTMINILNKGELDLLQCQSPVSATVKGIVATNPRKTSATNDLNAVISIAKGSVLKIPIVDASCDLKVYAHSAQVDNISCAPVDGGKIEGWVHFAFPNYSPSNTTFVAKLVSNQADFSNLMCIARTNNTFTGKVTGEFLLSGAASGRVLGSLEGEGSANVEDCIIARIPLFAGLTDWLARNIPGVSSVVNQSSARLDFTMVNGVATTENMWVEGNVFSVRCKGTYVPETDSVSMVARMNVLTEQSLVGWLVQTVTRPLTRILLEFRLSGTASNPEWSYINVFEKLSDAFF